MEKKLEFSTVSDPLGERGSTRKQERRGVRALTTRDHGLVRQWAARHKAEPATGEATSSGPATVRVNDGGAGIRFNFPGAAPFRPISWEEWFDHFDANGLTFLYEEEVADRAYEYFQARGGEHGHDREDWFEAERAMETHATPSARYRLIKDDM